MDYTIIGQIINTHGIRGQLKIYPITSDIERFRSLKRVFIGESKVECNVSSVMIKKGLVIIALKEYSNINEVTSFVKSYLFVSDEDRVVLPKDNYFIHDLVGCKIIDAKEGFVGELVDVIQGAANDVYVVKNGDAEILIPAVKEFIKNVDVLSKEIHVELIEGMI